MTSENISLLSETTPAQRTTEFQENDENISEKITNDGAKTATDCVAPYDNGSVSPPAKRKRRRKVSLSRKEIKTGLETVRKSDHYDTG